MNDFNEMVHYHKDRIKVHMDSWKTKHKVHINIMCKVHGKLLYLSLSTSYAFRAKPLNIYSHVYPIKFVFQEFS